MEEPFDLHRASTPPRPANARRRFGEPARRYTGPGSHADAGRSLSWGEARLMALGGVALGLAAAMLPWEGWSGRAIVPEAIGAVPVASAAPAIRFGLCHTGGGTNCVVDGDTFWMAGEKIRIADIDTPETHPPRCAEEARLGTAATLRLQALLSAGPVTLVPIDRDEDRYGRKLRTVEVGGVAVGEALVDEGLARNYGGGRRSWC